MPGAHPEDPPPAPAPSARADPVVAQLRAAETFAHLDQARLEALAGLFETAQYAAGAVIIRAGEIDTTLSVLVDGSVLVRRRLPTGEREEIGRGGLGSVLGLKGVFTGQPEDREVIAETAASFLQADSLSLWDRFEADPGLLKQIYLSPAIRDQIKRPLRGGSIRGEYQVRLFRRHLITLLPRLLFLPLAALACSGLGALLLSFVADSSALMLTPALLGLLGALALGAWLVLDYRNDFLVITNRRIIHEERTPLIDVQQSTARLDRIQDVRVVQPSIWSRLLRYGDVTVQTAGTQGSLRFTTVSQPERVKQAIFDQIDAAKAIVQRERQHTIDQLVQTAVGQGTLSVAEAAAQWHPKQAPARPEAQRAWYRARWLDYFLPWTSREDAGGVITWRKHWWVLLRNSVLPGLLMSLTVAVAAGVARASDDGLGAGAAAFFGFILFGLAFWLWWKYEDWRNDLYQLGQEHVVDMKRKPLGLFSERRQASLAQIQDVRFRVPNPWARILNYGVVVIETAAGTGNFQFDYVHRPASVQEKIFLRMEERELRRRASEQAQRDEDMLRWLGAYHGARLASEGPADSPAPGTPADSGAPAEPGDGSAAGESPDSGSPPALPGPRA